MQVGGRNLGTCMGGMYGLGKGKGVAGAGGGSVGR